MMEIVMDAEDLVGRAEDTASLFGPGRFGFGDELSDLVEIDRRDAMHAGERIRSINAFVSRRAAEAPAQYPEGAPVSMGVFLDQMRRSAYLEIRLARHLPARTSDAYVEFARELCHRFPRTVAAMCHGQISEAKAKTLRWECMYLPDHLATKVEDAVLGLAPGLTPANFARSVRKEVMRADPDMARLRREKAPETRRVEYRDLPDGMAAIHAVLPEAEAMLIMDRLTLIGRKLKRDNTTTDGRPADDDSRTLDQIRADLLLDLLLEHASSGVTYKVEVLTDDPDLDARTNEHDFNAAQAKAIRRRDQHCTIPGCRRRHCDLDHSREFGKGGPTLTTNGGLRCPPEHAIRHLPGWSIQQFPDGTTILTTPTGRRYRTRPPGRDGVDHPTEELPPLP